MTNWKACLANPRGRFTRGWFADHVATKELLKSGPFHGRVLDVGCGVGGRTFAVAQAYPEASVHGIDVSPAGIAHARAEFNLPNTHYTVGDALKMVCDDESFDFAFTLGVIEHILDTGAFLGEIQRVLRPGGKLFLAVTDRDYHRDSEHVHIFSPNKLLIAVKSLPFIVDRGYVEDHIIFVRAEKKRCD